MSIHVILSEIPKGCICNYLRCLSLGEEYFAFGESLGFGQSKPILVRSLVVIQGTLKEA